MAFGLAVASGMAFGLAVALGMVFGLAAASGMAFGAVALGLAFGVAVMAPGLAFATESFDEPQRHRAFEPQMVPNWRWLVNLHEKIRALVLQGPP